MIIFGEFCLVTMAHPFPLSFIKIAYQYNDLVKISLIQALSCIIDELLIRQSSNLLNLLNLLRREC